MGVFTLATKSGQKVKKARSSMNLTEAIFETTVHKIDSPSLIK